VGSNTLPVPDSRVVIIEGIYALSDKLKPLLDLRVSITGGVHFDLVRRQAARRPGSHRASLIGGCVSHAWLVSGAHDESGSVCEQAVCRCASTGGCVRHACVTRVM
jgi:hypothetical protein